MAETLVRQDIWKLETAGPDPFDEVTLAYALAIDVMKRRPASEPTSLQYQAEVHAIRGAREAPDDFRHQCQHFTWYFLPWHRMYLLWLERIVRSIIKDLDVEEISDETKETWALPYWNYEGGEETAKLPPAFRARRLRIGDREIDNPLFVQQRNRWMNDGEALAAASVNSGLAMEEVFFTEPRGRGFSGFGGSETDWHHGNERLGIPGELEVTPHGSVHTDVGGHMGGFATAGLDPLFYLHHCNIDRLWEVWLTLPKRANPDRDRWKNKEVFHFQDETGTTHQSTSGEVVDTVQLGYEYDDVTRPPVPRRRRRQMDEERAPQASAEPPAMVGATEDTVELRGAPATVEFTVEPPPGMEASRRRSGAPDAAPARVFLRVDNIEGEENPGTSYGVYVTPPGDEEDATSEDYHVGNLALFGIEEASDPDQEGAGGPGLAYAFEITGLVEVLEAEGRWDPERIKVTFAPNRPPADEHEQPPPIRVGRVSLYFG